MLIAFCLPPSKTRPDRRAIGRKFGHSASHLLKLTSPFYKPSHQFHCTWNSFEVLFKQRLKLLLHALKPLPTRVPYLFVLTRVSNVAGNPVTGGFCGSLTFLCRATQGCWHSVCCVCLRKIVLCNTNGVKYWPVLLSVRVGFFLMAILLVKPVCGDLILYR